MKDLWSRLESWHAKHASDLPFAPRPPATEKQIADAEKKIKMKLPEDFRASLLVHDGERDYDDERFHWMPGCDRLAPLKAIVAQWVDEQDRVQDEETEDAKVVEGGRFRNVLWHSKRIPIAGSPYWDQDNTYLDLIPGPKGTEGQLVTMTSECDFSVLHASFRAAFERYVEALESGEWIAETDEPKKKISGHSAEAFAKLVSQSGGKKAPKKTAKAPKKGPAKK